MARRFTPDPVPEGMPPKLGEWLQRQFRRLELEAQTTTIVREEVSKDFQDHVDDQNAHLGYTWKQDPTYRDLYPELYAGETPGIGTIDNPVNHVSIGHQGAGGSEGFLVERSALDGGGVSVIGIKGLDPSNPPPRPVQGNTIVELNGTATLVASGVLWLELATPLTEDHEVILGDSTTLADGRHFSPLLLGPKKIYQFSEFAEDAADYDVLTLGETEIVSLTTTNSYAADVSTFSYGVTLDNAGGQDTIFDIIIKLNGVEVGRDTFTYQGVGQRFSDSGTISSAVTAGDVISLHVDATGTHPNSEGWVRGTARATRIEIQQG